MRDGNEAVIGNIFDLPKKERWSSFARPTSLLAASYPMLSSVGDVEAGWHDHPEDGE